MYRKMVRLLPLLILASLVAACDGEREELIETRQVTLSGYTYDSGLVHVADASVELLVEGYSVQRRGEAELFRRLRGAGTLTVGGESYPLSLVADGPIETRPPCVAYYAIRRDVPAGNGNRSLLLYLSEDLGHAYGLVNLEEGQLGLVKETGNIGETSGPGVTAVCFSEEGKTIWEIYGYRDAQPSVVAVNLGLEISPLEKLRAHRDGQQPHGGGG